MSLYVRFGMSIKRRARFIGVECRWLSWLHGCVAFGNHEAKCAYGVISKRQKKQNLF